MTNQKTKQAILGILQTRTTNLSTIASELGKNPSTVQQHLRELMRENLVEYCTFGRPRKYYHAII